jgi:hypothetical protein
MALASPDVQNIVIGAPTQVAWAPYVTAKGAGTFYDIGNTMGGVEVIEKTERHEVIVDKYLGPVSSEPTKRNEQVKFKMAEAMMKNLALAMGNDPTAAVTGADPNFVFKRNMSERAYYSQLKVVGRGLGTTKVRTYLAYRTVSGEMEAIPLKKDAEQAYGTTVEVMEETTGAGTDSSNWTDA